MGDILHKQYFINKYDIHIVTILIYHHSVNVYLKSVVKAWIVVNYVFSDNAIQKILKIRIED